MTDDLGVSYRWARRAMAAAYEGQHDADFCAWLGTVDSHLRHTRRLVDQWPGLLDGRLQVLEQLGRLLGEHQDLSLLARSLAREPRWFDGQDQPVLRDMVEQRQQALRAMARPLGRRLFAEAPATFRRQLQQQQNGRQVADATLGA